MMRLWWIPISLFLTWFVFTLTPFWMLYDLASAVQARDVGYVERHVNFRILRQSMIRQISTAASQPRGEPGAEVELSRDRQRLIEAAAALAEPLTESLVTAQSVIDLLDDGIPQSLDIGPLSGDGTGSDSERKIGVPAGLRIDTISRLIPYYLSSEMRGFRTIVIAVPPEASRSQRFRLRLRLRGWSWRLVEIELPNDLRNRIASKVARAHSRPEQEAAPTPALR
ncbi:DUF2939 domain-containing protein [Methylobacterium sp. E-045]|uniref:DUF2939 domain-containing protein n=1 Tax=Methylobacterium sp. E-045 TaxID=2836575 RepID=UPI0028BD1A7F|nr:DUF2939 domain-containing protein [Methylobacterium sp. E-045]